jgi:hypothetical protein
MTTKNGTEEAEATEAQLEGDADVTQPYVPEGDESVLSLEIVEISDAAGAEVQTEEEQLLEDFENLSTSEKNGTEASKRKAENSPRKAMAAAAAEELYADAEGSRVDSGSVSTSTSSKAQRKRKDEEDASQANTAKELKKTDDKKK